MTQSRWLFLNTLRFFGRDELEHIEMSSKQSQGLIEREFPNKPYRLFASLAVENFGANDIMQLWDNGHVWNPLVRAWTNEQEHYSVDQMQQYLGRSIRVKRIDIALTGIELLREDVSALETVAHVWAGRNINIISALNFDDDEYRNALNHDLDMLLGSSIISRCRELSLPHLDVPYSAYPSLYSLEAFVSQMGETADNTNSNSVPAHWVDFLEGIGKHKSKVLPLLILPHNQLQAVIDAIQHAFINSTTLCAFKLYLLSKSFLTQSWDTNIATGEVLQMNMVNSDAANRILDDLFNFKAMDMRLYLMERKNILD
ncbi:hypothetical protein DdX_00320 [Ditylenchus destructor]|uniref:Uncharacterized protein n=1 Tax=Ditylenchus destructor TaxID=166010 RepID=A0AAD4NH64_9BILA|nr:hypothetical protein DdX_00320 [Ditylenchus destructor]